MGGGVMRTVAKLTGFTVATGGIRGITAERLPVSSSGRGLFSVRPAAVSVSSVDEMKLVTSHSQKPCLESDDWVHAGGEEEVVMCGGEPMPRVVFNGVPTLQEATEATSELAVSLEKIYLPSHDSVGYGNPVIPEQDLDSSLSNSQVKLAKACVIGEMEPVIPSPAVKAFRLLHESTAAQNVVASIACDPNVWTAVLQNPELQEFLCSQKTSLADSGADHLDELSVKSIEYSSKDSESEPGNSFGGFVHKIKVTLVDMMSNLSEFLQNFFGGKGGKLFANGVGTLKPSAENVMEASFLGLAVMAIMVILLKRV